MTELDSDGIFAMEKTSRIELSRIIRVSLLLVFIVTTFVLYHYAGYSQYFTKDKISITIDAVREFVSSFGFLGPILYTIAAAVAITINIPTFLIVCLSAIIFGKVAGTIISFIFVGVSTSLIYFIAQLLGRPFTERLFGKRLKKIEERLDERGLMTVFYIRLIWFNSPIANWVLSTTSVSYTNLFFGTILGTAHTIILLVWLSDMIIETIKAGEFLNPIKTPKLLLPICIGITIFITVRVFLGCFLVGSSRVDLQACKLEYSIVSPK